MRLSDFILASMEPILVEWEAFARTLLPAAGRMSTEGLRNHAGRMLTAIAEDLASAQTESDRLLKSRGLAPAATGAPATAAQSHASLRAKSGFSINQMVAEYRALRASVLSLWARQFAECDTTLADTIRFNEAIDQALAESIANFSDEAERARNLLLGMLGHDMRNPLNVITLTARHLRRLNVSEDVSSAAARLISSGARMRALLDDLVDFNRQNLGVGIHIVRSRVDLVKVFHAEVDLLRAANPQSHIDITTAGDATGDWDANRLHQLLGNLITNAIKYGDADGRVTVALNGTDTEVSFTVTNPGNPIPAELIDEMFEPLRRGRAASTEPGEAGESDSSLGLGLYIAREVARAHRGDISVRSAHGETTFLVTLPKMAESSD